MASLLTAIIRQRAGWDYPRRLLDFCIRNNPDHPVTAPADQLVEPLSERELDVLRLLATDVDGPEIARRLFVSLNTMRTHTKSIYAKLGVNSRRAAVRRAEEHGLL
jgi:LuxR family maltose regulon positive regulatory protein